MNLILTSAGLKVETVRVDVIKLLPKPTKELKLAHIITAAKVVLDKDFINRDKKALVDTGFQVTDLDIEGKTEKDLFDLLKDFDIIYVQGGNGFYLLKQIRDSGFDKVVRKLLKQGKWYIGVSAGTYVCCPTIEMHTWKREPENRYGLTNLKAMNLVPFLVSVHYNREKYKELLAIKIPTASHPVKILTDEQALYINNKEISLIGLKPEILAKDITG